MKKITSLLLLMSMLVMCFAVTNVSAATNDNLQYLLVDALGWSNEAGGATEQFNNAVLKNCLEITEEGDALDTFMTALADTTFAMIAANSYSAKVRALTKDEIKSALTLFANATTSSLVGKTVQQIYTEREFESKTAYTGQIGVGGYFGDGLKSIIPYTGAVPNYDFETLRKTLNEALTGEPENNNGLRFTLLYLREQVYINHMIGIEPADTHISSFDTYTGNFDFYISNKVPNNELKTQISNATSDLIKMLPALKAEVETKDGNNLTEKFMDYIEDILNADDVDATEKTSFYKFLDNNHRRDEGIIITSTSSKPTSSGGGGGGGGITTFVVTYANTVGGSLDGKTTEAVRYGSKLSSVPEPIPAEGYEFKGWSLDGGETIVDPTTITIDKKLTFTAVFVPKDEASTVVTYANTLGGLLNGGTTETVRYGSKLSNVPEPIPAEGYEFKGWSLDGGETIVDPTTITIDKKLTFTAIFVPKGAAGTDDSPFDLSSHYAYMQGYPNGSFRPEGDMTRAEVAVMFSRLLASKMNINENYECNFTDVKEDDWFKNHIGYMSQIGAISGYEDGTFNPNGNITRAEFATMASRFDKLTSGSVAEFTDIDETHWAYDYIGFASERGWITGYEDNTVRPDSYITRAEVVTVTNRILGRPATAEHTSYIAMPKDFTDVASTDWYYFDVVESTNDHDIPEAEESATVEGVTEEATPVEGEEVLGETTEPAEGEDVVAEEITESAEGEDAATEETTEPAEGENAEVTEQTSAE